jgi:outer membrane lipoprotein SlyB
METPASRDAPALGILVVTLAAVAFGLAIVAVQEWTPWVRGLEKAVQTTLSPTSASTPAISVCRPCGIIESVRSMDKADLGRAAAVTVRGLGDDLMSVLALVAGALVGNRFQPEAAAATIHEITVRFEDGSSRVLRSVGAREWELGDRVKVIQGRIYRNSSGSIPTASLAVPAP